MINAIEGLRIFIAYVIPAILGLAVPAVSVLFVGRLRVLESRLARSADANKSENASLLRSIETFKTGVHAALQENAAVARSIVGNTAMRGKVIKLHRLGRSPEQIADTLRLPKGEIALLLKIHAIVVERVESAQSETRDFALEKIVNG